MPTQRHANTLPLKNRPRTSDRKRGVPRFNPTSGARPRPSSLGPPFVAGLFLPRPGRPEATATPPTRKSAVLEADTGVLEALLTVVTTVSAGCLHPRTAPFLCAARLIPLENKEWGVRTIAVGDKLRRLTAEWLLATSQERSATAAPAPLRTAFAKGIPAW